MDSRSSVEKRRSIAVRELCAFTARAGDLDLRFTPAPTADEGNAGHAIVRRRRGANYHAEVTLEGEVEGLRIRGRADGLQPEPLLLEEIKTHRGTVEAIPDNHRALHWAQLKIYGSQLCIDRELEALDLRLVYFHVDSGVETHFDAHCTASDLLAFRSRHARAFAEWTAAQEAHRARRDAALQSIRFPHADFHGGQRLLANAVYRACATRHVLMAQAPTGIGKSIGTLFPALKAMGQGQLDKVFFLTAKSSGRHSALAALQSLSASGEAIPLRHLELVARDKACVRPDRACHGESCPRAKGFYDRLTAARSAALLHSRLDHATVQSVASTHSICPYYLAQELVRWVDVVIGDVNYYFGAHALLPALTAVNDWNVAVLVDEAHNLVERARRMYSAALSSEDLPRLPAKSDRGVARSFTALRKVWKSIDADFAADYTTLKCPPSALLAAVQNVSAAIGRTLADHPNHVPAVLLDVYFAALAFLERAETFGSHSLCDLQRIDGALVLTLRNVLPAPFLAPRFEAARATALFSATLHPAEYFHTLLGLPADTRQIDVPSPFSPAQLSVNIARRVSTRYRDRSASLAAIADIVAQQCAKTPGNYLAFFSSYAYLQQVEATIRKRHPELLLDTQTRAMREDEQAAFLAEFREGAARLGLAVLGGAFAEGIDLPGERLIGVFIATLGLPQVNPVQEAIKGRLEALFGLRRGYDYTYLYPGVQKIVQAAGRLIRTPLDRGTIWLVDERYTEQRVQRLLPAWWTCEPEKAA